jgi:hypothetical protein
MHILNGCTFQNSVFRCFFVDLDVFSAHNLAPSRLGNQRRADEGLSLRSARRCSTIKRSGSAFDEFIYALLILEMSPVHLIRLKCGLTAIMQVIGSKTLQKGTKKAPQANERMKH